MKYQFNASFQGLKKREVVESVPMNLNQVTTEVGRRHWSRPRALNVPKGGKNM